MQRQQHETRVQQYQYEYVVAVRGTHTRCRRYDRQLCCCRILPYCKETYGISQNLTDAAVASYSYEYHTSSGVMMVLTAIHHRPNRTGYLPSCPLQDGVWSFSGRALRRDVESLCCGVVNQCIQRYELSFAVSGLVRVPCGRCMPPPYVQAAERLIASLSLARLLDLAVSLPNE